MSEPYVGEIRMFGGNFAPAGWAFCNGQTLPISENETLFQLIGTTYGGDGESTFNLPDLQGRVPIHMGNNLGQSFVLGEQAGVESVTLTVNQIPQHTHTPLATTTVGTTANPSGTIPAAVSNQAAYKRGDVAADVAMDSSTLTSAGGSQPHDNTMPSVVISFVISLFGIFPSQ